MRKLTTAVATVAALGLTTPSLSAPFYKDDALTILMKGKVIANHGTNSGSAASHTLIVYGNKLYWCTVLKKELKKNIYVECYGTD